MRHMGHEALIMCSNVLYSCLAYLFNCGENEEPRIDDFDTIFGGIEFTQMANNFQIQ